MLVFTDIESSTTAAADAPRAMVLVQETHDRIMRQGIQRFAGYEIHTQGDAFEIAFATAVSATQFCLWTQDQLMSYDWPREVLAVPQFAAVVDEETDDVIFRGPRVRMGVHAAPPGTWRKATHGYTHHTVFGGEGVDLIAAVSDAGHGGQVVLTKDAADALIPRIHKVDALLESIGVFRVRAAEPSAEADDGAPLELFDCQPLPTPKRPRRVFSKRLRRIEYVAPGRSLAVIPPPPALHRDSTDEAFVVVVMAEKGTGDDAELADALAAVLAQQAQLAGGYLASPDACAEGGAVVIFRTDYGAAARFLAVLPVVLAWWEWPDGARKHVVVEGTAPVPTVRVKVAMHVSADIHEETISAEALAAKLAARRSARAGGHGGGGGGGGGGALGKLEHGIERAGSVLRRGGRRVIDAVELTGREAVKIPARLLGKQDSDRGLRLATSSSSAKSAGLRLAALDDLSEVTEMTEVIGAGLDRARAVAAAAHPGQCIMTLSAFTAVQAAARMPAGAFPVSLGRHAITRADLAVCEAPAKGLLSPLRSEACARGELGEELYELVSTFLGMRASTPRLETAQVLTPGYRQSPDPTRAVAVCFVSLSAPDRESETTKRALDTASAVLRVSLAAHRGYECKQPEPNKFTLAFADFDDAVSFTGDVHLKLLETNWEDELLRKRGCEPRVDPRTGDLVWRGLHARVGVAFGLGCTRKPLNTGRADYFGAVPNLAARICAVAQYGQTLIEPTEELSRARWPARERRVSRDSKPLAAEFARERLNSSARIRASQVVLDDAAETAAALPADVASSSFAEDEGGGASGGAFVAGAFEPRRWVDGVATAWDGTRGGVSGVSGMVIDLLGQFDLRGVTRRTTLAQALPTRLRAARSKTFDLPEGLAVAARDASVGAVSVAARDAHLHYDKHGLGKSAARGFVRSRSTANVGAPGALGAFASFASLLSPRKTPSASARKKARAEGGASPRAPPASAAAAAADASMDAMEAARGDPPRARTDVPDVPDVSDARSVADVTAAVSDASGASDAAPGAARLRGLDKFRKAGRLVAMANRFEGAARARRNRKGHDDWGFAGDLEHMPTAESERAAEDAAAARIGEGSGKGAARLTRGAD